MIHWILYFNYVYLNMQLSKCKTNKSFGDHVHSKVSAIVIFDDVQGIFQIDAYPENEID